MMSSLLLFLASLFIFTVNSHVSCGVGKVAPTPNHKNWNVKPKAPVLSTTTDEEGAPQHIEIDPRIGGDPVVDTYSNIRIFADTSTLEDDWDGIEDDLLSTFIDDVIPAAYEWIANVFSVKPVDGTLSFSRFCSSTGSGGVCTSVSSTYRKCGKTGAFIPISLFDEQEICSSGGTGCETTTYPQGAGMANVDIIIYFTGADEEEDDPAACTSSTADVMGFAASCEVNSNDRPIAGYINLCRDSINAMDPFTWEEHVALIIHETFHILGFSGDGFKASSDFKDSNGLSRTDVIDTVTIRGRERNIVTLPTVIEKAQEYFGCDSLPGLELEQSSSAIWSETSMDFSPHWENRMVLFDVMINYTPVSAPYSTFTLAVFADSGWYEINWDYAQIPTYGRDIGCDWYTSKCVLSDDETIDDKSFCGLDPVSSTCGSAYIGGGYCAGGTAEWSGDLPSQDQYFDDPALGGGNTAPDFCPIFEYYSNADCRLYGDYADGTTNPDSPAEYFGGLIAGTSKCIPLSGSSVNDDSYGCYPTECFMNYQGDYKGTRITSYQSSNLEFVAVHTCWDGEDGDSFDIIYDFPSSLDFGFTTMHCPVFSDICYKSNPWICNGHGTINSNNNECVCSPGYFGIDCTIEANKANRDSFSDTDSVNIYIKNICNDGEWDYDDDDEAVGALQVELTNINDDDDYNLIFFKQALQNWIAILSGTSQCDVELRDYVYSAANGTSTCTSDIYYFSADSHVGANTDSQIEEVFTKLFDSTIGFTIDITKEPDPVEVVNAGYNNTHYLIGILIMCAIYLVV